MTRPSRGMAALAIAAGGICCAQERLDLKQLQRSFQTAYNAKDYVRAIPMGESLLAQQEAARGHTIDSALTRLQLGQMLRLAGQPQKAEERPFRTPGFGDTLAATSRPAPA
jgi:hypothetical protein